MKTTNQIDREANERKAREITEQSAYLSDFPHDKKSVMYGALEAMKWKDKERKELWRITRNHYQEWAEEQIAKEKQQWVEKAVDFISKRFYIGINNRVISNLIELIRDFEQTMKG